MCTSMCVCLSLSLCVLFLLVCVGPVHVEGLTAGFLYPTPRHGNVDIPFNPGTVCDPQALGAPKSTLYYGKNQVVVRLGDFTENNVRQIQLYGYVNSNSVNKSTSISAGSYEGVAWSYDLSSARVLSRVSNATTFPRGFNLVTETRWNQAWEIDIPQGITCTPHCTLQFVATTVSPSGSSTSVVSCLDVNLMERRPTSIYLTLRPDGCCPLEPVTIARRLHELSDRTSPFGITSYPVYDYVGEFSWMISNVWQIDATAPNTFQINPQTGYYSVKIIINDQYNLTAQQFITTLTNTQLVSSALSPDSRGANNTYVWWGNAPNTYLPGGTPLSGAGKNTASASASASASPFIIAIFTIASTCITAVIGNYAKHI